MRKIFYNYYLPFRNFFIDNAEIETFSNWYNFRNQWNIKGTINDPIIIIVPVITFDLIGFDIRFVFRNVPVNNKLKFLLIGTTKQINFALSQNMAFLKNTIEEVTLPHDFDTLELAIIKKINTLENQKRGRGNN